MPQDDLQQALHKNGLRLTRARAAVLQVLAASSEHLKVAEVQRRARKIDVPAPRTTTRARST